MMRRTRHRSSSAACSEGLPIYIHCHSNDLKMYFSGEEDWISDPEHEEGLTSFAGVSCFQTVFSLVWYIGYIAQGIDQVTLNQTCPDSAGIKGCSGGITNVVQNLAWLLVAAAQVPQYCVEGFISPNSVNCFTSMTTFTGSGVEIASDALNSENDCAYLHQSPSSSSLLAAKSLTNATGHGSSHAQERSTLPAPARARALKWWLNSQGSANPPPGYGSNSNSGVPGNRANTQAECAFQSMETMDDILTVALNTWALVKTCVGPLNNATDQELCASDLLALVGALPNVAQDIFNLLDECNLFYKIRAPCAADAADIAQCALGV
ncbi:ATP-dependent RNA helicase mtr4 [Durusdinium trenchii]